MAANSFLSNDSLGELSEIDILKDKLKQKETIISDKSEIISSLRQQVQDLNHDNEELENNQQILYQKIDRLTRELEEKNEELEAVSHALKEIESSNESLQKRYTARTSQVQKFVDDLIKTKKELEETQAENEQLKHKQEQLTIELELANSKKRASLDENLPEPTRAMHLAMADEVGEFMEPSSSLRLKGRTYFNGGLRSLSDEINVIEPPIVKEEVQYRPPPPSTQQQQQQRPQLQQADLNYCPSHRLKRFQPQQIQQEQPQPIRQEQPQLIRQQYQNQNQHQQLQLQKENFDQPEDEYDPIAEYKSRVARANELARRNMQTKPLHQTSYALELDTFDTMDLTEHEIKRGNVKHPKLPPKNLHQQLRQPPQRQPPQPPRQRQALANFSNTPPKRVYKKAEAFIV